MRALILLLAALLALAGCGGGGGGGTPPPTQATAVGEVIWLPTGGPPTPPATVQIGNASTQTGSDGSFTLSAPAGSTSVLVVYQPTQGGAPVSFRYDIAPLTGTADLGILVIAPETVTVQGRVVNAADGSPLPGARVRLAGRQATTNAQGQFALADVPYSTQNPAAFFGLEGRVTLAGFFARTFFPSQLAQNGVVTIEDLVMSPEGATDPPPLPFTLEGRISPTGSASGTVVTVLQNGQPVRQQTVGNDARYAFWVPPGSYVLRFQNPTNGLSAPDVPVTLTAPDQVIRRDVTLQ